MLPQIGSRDYILIPQCNLYMNDHFVIFKDGVIYHNAGEFNGEGKAIHKGIVSGEAKIFAHEWFKSLQ